MLRINKKSFNLKIIVVIVAILISTILFATEGQLKVGFIVGLIASGLFLYLTSDFARKQGERRRAEEERREREQMKLEWEMRKERAREIGRREAGRLHRGRERERRHHERIAKRIRERGIFGI